MNTTASVSVPVAFNDDNTRHIFEANTIDTNLRINTLSKLEVDQYRSATSVLTISRNIFYLMEFIFDNCFKLFKTLNSLKTKKLISYQEKIEKKQFR